jgi:hypothetical protein
MWARSWFFLFLVSLAVSAANQKSIAEIWSESGRFKIGNRSAPEWNEWMQLPFKEREFLVQFPAGEFNHETSLVLLQDNIKNEWEVFLNGQRLGLLFQLEYPLWISFKVPAGLLKPTGNELRIAPRKEIDREDIVLGPIQLASSPVLHRPNLGLVKVSVRGEKGEPLPARITITDPARNLALFRTTVTNEAMAVRPGVVYSLDGKADLELPAGSYRIYASRGAEYGVASMPLEITAGETRKVNLRIAREVQLPGWKNCDTHVHTLTLSKHGDAKLTERIVTMAGEGLDAAVTTEHNLTTNYSHPQLSSRWLTVSIPGNEITTARGHFNIFPLPLAGSNGTNRFPNPQLTNWTDLMKEFTTLTPQAFRVLNHPTDVHAGFRPFSSSNLHLPTGKFKFPLIFHGIELINSGAMQSDQMAVVSNWFALLNHGNQITGVGSSDSHDITRYVVGQGRTYFKVPKETQDSLPAALADSLKAGRAVASLGLFCEIEKVRWRSSKKQKQLVVEVSTKGASWMLADRVQLFANGQLVAQTNLFMAASKKGGWRKKHSFTLPAPAHDVYLVAIASGPGIVEPFWQTPRPYQKDTTVWAPRNYGITNPFRVDADQDGNWESPREIAQRLVLENVNNFVGLQRTLSSVDDAVFAQLVELVSTFPPQKQSEALQQLHQIAAPARQQRIAEISESLRQFNSSGN